MTKRTVLVLALVAILVPPFIVRVRASRSGAQSDDLASAPRISQLEFRKALASGTIRVLDVRDRASYVAGHIPGAESMPLDEVVMRVKELKAERRPIVTYCA